MYCMFLRRIVYFAGWKGIDAEGVSVEKIVPKRSNRQAWTKTSKGIALRKVKLMIAVLAMTLMAAAPAMADTAPVGGFTAESQFFGGDSAVAGGAKAESQFFDGDIFGSSFFN